MTIVVPRKHHFRYRQIKGRVASSFTQRREIDNLGVTVGDSDSIREEEVWGRMGKTAGQDPIKRTAADNGACAFKQQLTKTARRDHVTLTVGDRASRKREERKLQLERRNRRIVH